MERHCGTEDGGARISIGLREELGQHIETVSSLANDILIRDEAVGENKFSIVGKPFAHLVVDAANGEAGSIPLHEKTGAAVGEWLPFVRLCEQ